VVQGNSVIKSKVINLSFCDPLYKRTLFRDFVRVTESRAAGEMQGRRTLSGPKCARSTPGAAWNMGQSMFLRYATREIP